jgi:hypothetical protein
MDELKVLQAVRLKGRVNAADLAATIAADAADVDAIVAELTEAGWLVAGKALKISPEGRQRLTELLAQERSGVDEGAVAETYDDFRSANADFKALVADWQLKDGAPNTHKDAEYDAAVLARLVGVHEQVMPIIAVAAAQLPRLACYADKLAAALTKVRAGDTMWFTRPLIDSYHTVWFEFHEELIVAAGLTREDEANAGHAQ